MSDFIFSLDLQPGVVNNEETKSNRMVGRGTVLGISTSDIDSNVNLKLTTSINAEVMYEYKTNNKMEGVLDVVRMPTNIYKTTDSSSTYIYNRTPLINYSNASSLLSGTTSKEDTFKSFIKFNNLQKIDKKIIKNMLNAKIKFYDLNSTSKSFDLYTLENKLDTTQITYLNYPNVFQNLGTVKFNNEDKSYEIDITKYLKKIYDGEAPNNGFTFVNDNIINVFSLNSNTKKPEIQISWVNPNMYINKSNIQSECDLLMSNTIKCECMVDDLMPRIESELILTKDNLYCETSLLKQNNIECQVMLGYPLEESSLESEVDLSYVSPTRKAEVKVALYNNIDAEVNLQRFDENYTEAELKLKPVSMRISEIDLRFSNNIPSEVNLMTKDSVKIDSETILSKPDIIAETNILLTTHSPESIINLDIIDKNNIDSEVKLCKIINNAMLSQVKLLKSSSQECQVNLDKSKQVLENNIDAQTNLKFIDDNNINAETKLSFLSYSSILSEAHIVNENSQDCEVNLKFIDSTNINAETELSFLLYSSIPSEVQIVNENSQDCEVNLKSIKQSHIESTVTLNKNIKQYGRDDILGVVKVNKRDDILGEVKLRFINSSNIDSEVKVNKRDDILGEVNICNPDTSNIDSEVKVNKRDDILGEVNIAFTSCSYVDSEVKVNKRDDILGEVKLRFINSSDIDSEVKVVNESYQECEIDLKKIKHLSNVDAQVLLKLDNDISIDSEVDLMLSNNINSDVNLKFINSSTLNCEIDLIKHMEVYVKIYEV